MSYQEILAFWFEEIESAKWWQRDEAFDQRIIDKFSKIHSQAAQCELYHWREEAKGRLAEIIVLDQFSRNMFRDTARAFAYDAQALVLAQCAIVAKADQALENAEKHFLYMPFMHSESLKIHEAAVGLFKSLDGNEALDFELKHKAIIERFGRYPHRNAVLGRKSTQDEIEFLKKPGSSF